MKRTFFALLFSVCTLATAQSSDDIETIRDQRDAYAVKLDALSEAMGEASFNEMLAHMSCPQFDTDQVRADLASPSRTDREWFETIIKRMAWNLDCWQGERHAD